MEESSSSVVAGRSPVHRSSTLFHASHPSLNRVLSGKERLGVEHMSHLADATNALSLVSTLVLSISLSSLLNPELILTHEPAVQAQVVLLCGACAASTCTLCFSLLEYFYLQTMGGVDSSFKDALHSSKEERISMRVDAAAATDAIFESFRLSRKFSRNCIWVSLVLLLASVAAKLIGEFVRLEAASAGSHTMSLMAVLITSCVLLVLGCFFVIVHVPMFRLRYWSAIQNLRNQRRRSSAGGMSGWPESWREGQGRLELDVGEAAAAVAEPEPVPAHAVRTQTTRPRAAAACPHDGNGHHQAANRAQRIASAAASPTSKIYL